MVSLIFQFRWIAHEMANHQDQAWRDSLELAHLFHPLQYLLFDRRYPNHQFHSPLYYSYYTHFFIFLQSMQKNRHLVGLTTAEDLSFC